MTELQKGILTLLRCALTGEKGSLPEHFPWPEAVELLGRHHCSALGYAGAIRCGAAGDNPWFQRLFLAYARERNRSLRQMEALKEICDAFQRENLRHMPLKGSVLKALYPAPELRFMGDADILIEEKQYKALTRVMESLGFCLMKESDHEIVWEDSRLHVELHKRLIPSYNKDYNRYYGRGWRLARREEGSRWAMGPEDCYLYILTHLAKHYRDGGVGFRQVLDLWVYRRAHPELREAYLKGELEKLELTAFHAHLLALLGAWFQGEAGDGATEAMTDFIFSGGAWGMARNHALSREVKQAGVDSLRRGRLRHIFQAVFPNASALADLYPVLRRKPWLLPWYWAVRWWDLVFRRRKAVTRFFDAMDQYDPEEIRAYRRDLEAVGLRFHFR